MKRSAVKQILLVIGLPVAFALVVRGLFGIEDWTSFYSVMTISFIFLLPVGVGALTIAVSKAEQAKNIFYQLFAPWLPICAFFVLTLLLSIEGWGCWIMILPVFLVAGSIGGLIAGYFKQKKKDDRMYLSLLVLLPFFASPIEQMIGSIPGQYKAYTYVDIHAGRDKIWSNVTRVRAINKEENNGWLTGALGLPRPIKAELNYEGVGAFRKAIFDKGLVFDETVLKYKPQQLMVFSIRANPYDIPSTTMDKHIVIGGEYFDVLNGTYELEQLNSNTFRLHLYSHFKLTTTFNFYASWWAGWIMKDIQKNILQVIKARAEKA